mmetsp:Transcript_64089/g.206439  ORF Transcript_64089/g.206439 Transcript_64089/m.206439 type:complete len:453 (-) Transcript_64089:409-1767(-)
MKWTKAKCLSGSSALHAPMALCRCACGRWAATVAPGPTRSAARIAGIRLVGVALRVGVRALLPAPPGGEELRDVLEGHAFRLPDVGLDKDAVEDVQHAKEEEGTGHRPRHHEGRDDDDRGVGNVVQAHRERHGLLLLGHGEDLGGVDPGDRAPGELEADAVEGHAEQDQDAGPVVQQAEARDDERRAHDPGGAEQLAPPAAVLGVHERQPGGAAADHDEVEDGVEEHRVVNADGLEDRRGIAQEGVDARRLLGEHQDAGDDHALAEVGLRAHVEVAHLLDALLLPDLLVHVLGLRHHVAPAGALELLQALLEALGLHDEARRLGDEGGAGEEGRAGEPGQEHAELPVVVEERDEAGDEAADDHVQLEERARGAADGGRGDLRVVDRQAEAAHADPEARDEAAGVEHGHGAEGHVGGHQAAHEADAAADGDARPPAESRRDPGRQEQSARRGA